MCRDERATYYCLAKLLCSALGGGEFVTRACPLDADGDGADEGLVVAQAAVVEGVAVPEVRVDETVVGAGYRETDVPCQYTDIG